MHLQSKNANKNECTMVDMIIVNQKLVEKISNDKY